MTPKEFKEYLQTYSVQSPQKFQYVEKSPLELPFDEVKKIGEGIFNKVYKVKVQDQYWIMKEGRYDLRFPLFSKAKIPLPRKVFAWLFGWFRMDIMPSHRVAIEQFSDYVLLCKYFGFFDYETEHSVIKYDPTVLRFQREIRELMKKSIEAEDEFAELILESVKTFKNYHKIKELILNPEINTFNYLPQEYLILSLSSPIKRIFKKLIKKRETYYIIQKMIEGRPISQVNNEELKSNPVLLGRLIYFIILSIFLVFNEKKVIDSRPESILGNFNDWFSKTGNIFINFENFDVKFIDTRWFWSHRKGNLLEKSFGELMVNSTKWKLTEYVELYD